MNITKNIVNELTKGESRLLKKDKKQRKDS